MYATEVKCDFVCMNTTRKQPFKYQFYLQKPFALDTPKNTVVMNAWNSVEMMVMFVTQHRPAFDACVKRLVELGIPHEVSLSALFQHRVWRNTMFCDTIWDVSHTLEEVQECGTSGWAWSKWKYVGYPSYRVKVHPCWMNDEQYQDFKTKVLI